MSTPPDKAFCTFVRSSCGDLIGQLSQALGIPLGVRGAEGEAILSTSGTENLGYEELGGVEEISVPIRMEEETLGYVVARSGEPRIQDLVESLASDIGRRFHLHSDLEHMTDELSQSFDEINLLYEFARLLRPDDSFVSNGHRLLDQTAELLEHRFLVLALPERKVFASSVGPSLCLSEDLRRLGSAPANLQKIHEHLRETVTVGRAGGCARLEGVLESPSGSCGYIAIPVWVHSFPAGFVGLLMTEEQETAETGELRLLECLAEQITHMVENHKLNRDLSQLLFNTVKSLVAAIEANDPYTRGHSERVFYLSVLIGERLDLSPEELQTLSWAALLHDIGKLGIDGKLLNKPTNLNMQELLEIRDHPERGCKVLDPIPQLWPILPGIRHHHERFDGMGYPDGLRGEEIPLTSRIIAIADTFDALTSARAYRSPVQKEDALQEIEAMAGTQFDPRLVDTFLDVILNEDFPDQWQYEDRKEVA